MLPSLQTRGSHLHCCGTGGEGEDCLQHSPAVFVPPGVYWYENDSIAVNNHSLAVSLSRTEQLKAHPPPIEVVCYGIGHFGSCPIARMQFALLLVIREQCKVRVRSPKHNEVQGTNSCLCTTLPPPPTQPDCTWVYDPILCEEEVSSLKGYNCTPIPTNEVRDMVH